ncbi:hypothetical protein [Nocardioides jejuensis]|uniref:Uncharacterized protein n=1 Tax=Nocardioides jejuensis TaxID=2502782 RepID=A0A4R1BWD9_9ACTN|nr:hypothetical protein [Nocardioides jejuensis]TCJ21666.1 hypothetical protein EPD65_14660 [Nocardioides jejuensis]
MSAQSTATERRRIAISALARELDGSNPASSAARLSEMLDTPRQMIVSADIDGLVSAAMLASVAPSWNVVGLVASSSKWLLHPSVSNEPPAGLVAVDLFSLNHDSISNHVVKYGAKRPMLLNLRAEWQAWDAAVAVAAQKRLFAVPSIWAGTQGCYDDAAKADSSKWKYPLGTAQILLALLEAADRPPKFFDRHYLPWLVANCDGGVSTYTKYAANARVWWAVMAGAVGPASLTEQVFRLVDGMRPHDFLDTVNALDRERQASGLDPWLNDDWNLANSQATTIERCLRWLADLTGWRDPLLGGIDSFAGWVEKPVKASGAVYIGGANVTTKSTEAAAVASLQGARSALNANFYHGGFSGSRFNWIGGW